MRVIAFLINILIHQYYSMNLGHCPRCSQYKTHRFDQCSYQFRRKLYIRKFIIITFQSVVQPPSTPFSYQLTYGTKENIHCRRHFKEVTGVSRNRLSSIHLWWILVEISNSARQNTETFRRKSTHPTVLVLV